MLLLRAFDRRALGTCRPFRSLVTLSRRPRPQFRSDGFVLQRIEVRSTRIGGTSRALVAQKHASWPSALRSLRTWEFDSRHRSFTGRDALGLSACRAESIHGVALTPRDG